MNLNSDSILLIKRGHSLHSICMMIQRHLEKRKSLEKNHFSYLSINNGIEITLMHPSALLVKLVTVSSGEKEREREIGKERQEEKTREKRRKIKGSICVFFVCVCFVSYSLPIFMTAQNEGERKCVLERQWARPGSRVQTSAIELLIKSHNKKIIPLCICFPLEY